MRNNKRYLTTFGFIDLLFNMLVGFVFMFFIAYILINPIADDGKVDPPDVALLVINWPDDSKYDIDVWVRDPSGRILSFTNKTIPGMHLEKDDLGQQGDTFAGELLSIKNQEVVHITHMHEGTYYVTLHLYATHGREERQNVTVELMTIKNFKKVGIKEVIMSKKGQEESIVSFKANSKQQLVKVDWDWVGTIVDWKGVESTQQGVNEGSRVGTVRSIP